MSDPFAPGAHFDDLENCIARLEVNAPAYKLVLDSGLTMPPHLEAAVMEDCGSVFYPRTGPIDVDPPMSVDHIQDPNLRAKATTLLPLVN